jgi:WD40 repeat protein
MSVPVGKNYEALRFSPMNMGVEEQIQMYNEREGIPCYSQGKSGGIWRVLSLGGNDFVSASYDHKVKIWSHENGEDGIKLHRTHTAHTREALSVARLNPETLISGSSDGGICFWNLNNHTLQDRITEKKVNGIYSIGVINQNTIVTGSCQWPQSHKGSWDHVIKIWDITQKQLVGTLKGHTGGVSSIVSLQEGQFASGSGDSTVRIWDVEQQASVRMFKVHDDYIYGLTASTQNCLFTASRDRNIKIIDPRSEAPVGSLEGPKGNAHESTIYDVKCNSNDLIASCSRDGYIRVWDTRNNKSITTIDAQDGFVYSVDFLSNGTVVAGTGGKNPKQKNAHVMAWHYP